MLKLLVQIDDNGPDQQQMEMLGMFFDALKQKNTTALKLAGEKSDQLTLQLEQLTTVIDAVGRPEPRRMPQPTTLSPFWHRQSMAVRKACSAMRVASSMQRFTNFSASSTFSI